MERRKRREPRDLEDFNRRYKPKHPITFDKDSKGVREMMQFLTELTENSNGAGHQILFPMTEMAAHYEYVRGIMRVLAPKTKIIALRTPKRHTMIEGKGEVNERAKAALATELRRYTNPDSKSISILDLSVTGATKSAISRSIRDVGFNGPVNSISWKKIDTTPLNHIDQKYNGGSGRRLGWTKDDMGQLTQNNPTKQSAEERRMLYHLGMALAKEYRASQTATHS